MRENKGSELQNASASASAEQHSYVLSFFFPLLVALKTKCLHIWKDKPFFHWTIHHPQANVTRTDLFLLIAKCYNSVWSLLSIMINTVHPVLTLNSRTGWWNHQSNWPNEVKPNTPFLYLSVPAPPSLKTKLQVTLSLSQTCTHRHMHIYNTHHMHTHNSELFFYTNTKRFKWMLTYFNTDTQYANLWGNPLYEAT